VPSRSRTKSSKNAETSKRDDEISVTRGADYLLLNTVLLGIISYSKRKLTTHENRNPPPPIITNIQETAVTKHNTPALVNAIKNGWISTPIQPQPTSQPTQKKSHRAVLHVQLQMSKPQPPSHAMLDDADTNLTSQQYLHTHRQTLPATQCA